jgi:serine/threonine protein kinase
MVLGLNEIWDLRLNADHGHAEGRVNYGRWLRLLGKWEGSDRSADTSCQPPSRDDLAAKFIGGLDDPKQFDADSTKFLESVQRLKESRIKRRMISSASAEFKIETQIKVTPFFQISLKRSSNGTLIAVKRSESDAGSQRIHRGAFIQRSLSHPLLIGFHKFIPQSDSEKTTIITEFAGNGTLADHLPITAEREKSGLSGTNRIMQIIVGVVLGMRYLHSLGIIHRNLNPDTILINWDWNVRLSNFGRSISRNFPDPPLVNASGDHHYQAPEWYENEFSSKSDVFSFGLILYELIVGEPVIPKDWNPLAVVKRLSIDGFRPNIPDWVCSEVKELITDCWAQDPLDRPSFEVILERLEEMDFKLIFGVKPAKLAKFVRQIKERESVNQSVGS